MALTHSPPGELGSLAPAFDLPGVDGARHRLADFGGCRALVVVFMCNHCPYVKAVRGRINQLARDGAARGVRVVGINSNDSVRYPDDSFEAMAREAAAQKYVFPYLWDESQAVARAYGAVCTPDFFVYAPLQGDVRSPRGADFKLRYRGRLDDCWKDESAVRQRDLQAALDAILAGRDPAGEQVPSMGCSIKWKAV